MEASASPADPRTREIWEAILCIPESVLEDYVADNVIDDDEIEDISQRLEAMCKTHNLGFTLDSSCHDLLRRFVWKAVEHLRTMRQRPGTLEDKIPAVTLADIRSSMAQLLKSGQILDDVKHLSKASKPAHGDSIPSGSE